VAHNKRRFLGEFVRSILAVALYCGFLAAGAYGALRLYESLPKPEHADAVPAADWSESTPGTPTLTLDLAEFVDGTPKHIVRRHSRGGGRRDLIVWERSGERTPAFAIEIYRRGTEAEAAPDPIKAIPSRLARPAETTVLPSKFGAFTLSRSQETGEHGRLCVGFVRPADEASPRIAGLYCDRLTHAKAVEVVACALDRLSLVSAGGDGKLAGLFARAQLRQSTCGPGRMPAASVVQRDAWIEMKDGNGLRSVSAR
jgi:hypothetical protein